MRVFLTRRSEMNWQNIFNWRRFVHLLKNEIMGSYRSLLVSAGAVSGVLMVIYLAQIATGHPTAFHSVYYPLVLFIGGFLISSKIFGVIHDRRQNYVYLTLPASNCEKLVSKLTLSALGWVIGSVVFYFLFSVLAAAIGQLIWNDSMVIFNPFDNLYLKSAGIYLILQSMFVFASVYFKKNAMAKLVASLFLIGMLIALFTGLMARIILAKYIPWHGNMTIDFDNYIFQSNNIESLFLTIGEIIKYLFLILMAPYFWVLSYIRLRETEV